jgi:hypothetical protein
MSASDTAGNETGNIHLDNPFNVPDLTVLAVPEPPEIYGASLDRTSAGLGTEVNATLWARDDTLVGNVRLYFNGPDGGLIEFSCYTGWQDHECNAIETGGQGDLETPGTYTYSHMSASDTAGNETGNIHLDNPFNVPDLTVGGW